MSLIRDPVIITAVGHQMMTAGGDITYTKATLYGQDISHLTKDQLESLTSIGNPLVTVPLGISDKNDNGNGTTVILEATFQNSNLKADLPYTAVGFFAKRGDDAEKLIAVGVATEGAYLAATSPDGVATDALDIKVAIAIGDSANVTAMIDPAGSVTPAALHNAITDVKSEMKTGLDTKADKQTVTDDLVKKADKTDVDAQIGTVNKSVSDLSDTVKANKDDTDKVLATKADKATVESELSTKANQSDLDKTNAEVAKKASTTDVNSQLATKADAKDVTDALALKDDTVDVDKKISNITNSVNSLSSTVTSNKSATDTALGTKANANDVANSFEEVRNRVKKLEGQQELTAPDFNTLTSTGIYMIENPTNGKNSPSNGNWGTLVVSRGTTGSDSRILQEYYPDSGDLPYFRMSGPGGVWRDWKQLSDQSEINSLRDAVNTKADKTDVAKDIDTVNKSISSMSATITANQKATDTALDTKADKTTVNQELATKANSTDVDKKLDKKADTSDVDAKIKVVTDLTNTKANTVDVDSKIKTVTDLANTKANSADVYTKTETDNQINKFDLSKVKFRKQFLNGDGDKVDKTWSATKNDDGTYTIDLYNDDWTASKLADVLAQLPNKVDTSTVNAQIADTKNAIKSNTDKLQSAINTKANASDVYTKKQVDDAFSSRDATIATKADKATVDAEIAKIDFTPYAKSADVANELQNYTTTVDLNKLLAGKEDAGTSYSKAELDKKLLTLSTDTDGKVNADQVSSMIANKVDKSDLASDLKSINDSIATKANTTDVANANNNANGRLPLGGGNMTLRSTINWNGGGIDDKTGNLGGLNWAGGTDWAKIYGDQDDNDNLDLAFDLGDDGSNHFSFRQNGSETSAITSDGHYTGTVDWGHVNGRPQDQVDRVNIITPLFRQIQNSNNWNDIFGVGNPNNVLTSLRIDSGGSGALLNDFAAGIGFGGADTKGVLSVAYNDHQARITGGNGTSPVWSEDIAWKSDVNDLRNQVQQLRENQFEVQTFTDATAAANWEAQKPGHRLAIVNK